MAKIDNKLFQGLGNVVFIIGTELDDTLTGTNQNDFIFGRGGNDTLSGLEGDDFLDGGDGNDNINGGSGNNIMFGGNGNDNVSTWYTHEGNFIFGGNGDDFLGGGFGEDSVYGENGNDNLYGYYGNDILDGGAGNDTIQGSMNNTPLNEIDRLTGGTGADTFALHFLTPGGEALSYKGDNSNYALITDFNKNEDTIELTSSENPIKYDLSPVKAQYSLGAAPSGLPKGTGIYLNPQGEQPDLIAILQDVDPNSVSLSESYFQFV